MHFARYLPAEWCTRCVRQQELPAYVPDQAYRPAVVLPAEPAATVALVHLTQHMAGLQYCSNVVKQRYQHARLAPCPQMTPNDPNWPQMTPVPHHSFPQTNQQCLLQAAQEFFRMTKADIHGDNTSGWAVDAVSHLVVTLDLTTTSLD